MVFTFPHKLRLISFHFSRLAFIAEAMEKNSLYHVINSWSKANPKVLHTRIYPFELKCTIHHWQTGSGHWHHLTLMPINLVAWYFWKGFHYLQEPMSWGDRIHRQPQDVVCIKEKFMLPSSCSCVLVSDLIAIASGSRNSVVTFIRKAPLLARNRYYMSMRLLFLCTSAFIIIKKLLLKPVRPPNRQIVHVKVTDHQLQVTVMTGVRLILLS